MLTIQVFARFCDKPYIYMYVHQICIHVMYWITLYQPMGPPKGAAATMYFDISTVPLHAMLYSSIFLKKVKTCRPVYWECTIYKEDKSNFRSWVGILVTYRFTPPTMYCKPDFIPYSYIVRNRPFAGPGHVTYMYPPLNLRPGTL